MMFGCDRYRSNNKLVQGERDRIQKNADLADRIAELDRFVNYSIQRAVLKAKFECAPQSGCSVRLRELTQQRETLLGQTARRLVRKAALQALLNQDRTQNTAELHLQGKSIYKQRL